MMDEEDDKVKLISWNVNGLRAVVGKGFVDIFNALDADVFCLQETKLQAGQIELDLPLLWRPVGDQCRVE